MDYEVLGIMLYVLGVGLVAFASLPPEWAVVKRIDALGTWVWVARVGCLPLGFLLILVGWVILTITHGPKPPPTFW